VIMEYFVPGSPGIVLGIAAGVLVYPIGLRLLRAVPAEDGQILISLTSSLPGRLQSVFRRFFLFVSPDAADDGGKPVVAS
jgi:hypothetical protein